MEIRSTTIPYCINKKKRQIVQEKNLNEKYKKLHETMNSGTVSQDIIDEFHKTKVDLEAFEKQQAQGVILRSKSQWVEEGEKYIILFAAGKMPLHEQSYFKIKG